MEKKNTFQQEDTWRTGVGMIIYGYSATKVVENMYYLQEELMKIAKTEL